MNSPKLLFVLVGLVLPMVAFASESPVPDDLAQCVKTTTNVFNSKDDRDPKMLEKYYAPPFRALIKKGIASEAGEAAFLDADFLRLTQDTLPKIAQVGPAVAAKGRISVPVLLRYAPGVERTNTAVFERIGDRWMICDLVSSDGSLAQLLRKEFGR